MPIEIVVASELPGDAEAIGVPVTADLRAAAPGAEVDAERCARRHFKAKPGTTLVDEDDDGKMHVLVGIGDAGAKGTDSVRRGAAGFARAAGQCRTAALDLRGLGHDGTPAAAYVQAAVEGVLLAGHRYERYKSEPETGRLERLVVVASSQEAATGAVAQASAVASAVNLARDLVNEPAASMTPSRLASVATEVAAASGVEIEVFDEERAIAERLGGLLGVARGSAEPPRLVKLVYQPGTDVEPVRREDGSIATVALVGKGITFDSGGLSLKSGEGMMTMKTDMSGAAAVIATLGACRAVGVPVRVVGFAPITENMPGGRATKPGDVLTTRNGKTIEVLNTDAEGRLVLADGLTLAVEEHPDAIVDIATLTGACVVALGREIAGLFSNDDGFAAQVRRASERAGEALWPLPLAAEYRRHIDSEIADMKNIGKAGQGGAIAAALLLEEFVDGVPWAHLDIAGPARAEEERDYLHKGATGFGVRTLIELVRSFVPPAG
jgi:leucyl aminopeptidase